MPGGHGRRGLCQPLPPSREKLGKRWVGGAHRGPLGWSKHGPSSGSPRRGGGKGRSGPRPPSSPPLSWLPHPCPSFPGYREEGKGRCPCWDGGPQGAPQLPGVSTEKSDAVRESWKQAREKQGGMWGGQLNPRFWNSPGATQQAPLCVGKEGAKR